MCEDKVPRQAWLPTADVAWGGKSEPITHLCFSDAEVWPHTQQLTNTCSMWGKPRVGEICNSSERRPPWRPIPRIPPMSQQQGNFCRRPPHPPTKLPLSHSKKAVWLGANVPFNMALGSQWRWDLSGSSCKHVYCVTAIVDVYVLFDSFFFGGHQTQRMMLNLQHLTLKTLQTFFGLFRG